MKTRKQEPQIIVTRAVPTKEEMEKAMQEDAKRRLNACANEVTPIFEKYKIRLRGIPKIVQTQHGFTIDAIVQYVIE